MSDARGGEGITEAEALEGMRRALARHDELVEAQRGRPWGPTADVGGGALGWVGCGVRGGVRVVTPQQFHEGIAQVDAAGGVSRRPYDLVRDLPDGNKLVRDPADLVAGEAGGGSYVRADGMAYRGPDVPRAAADAMRRHLERPSAVMTEGAFALLEGGGASTPAAPEADPPGETWRDRRGLL